MTRAEAQRDEALKRSGAESSCACCVWVIFCVQSGLWKMHIFPSATTPTNLNF